MFTGIIEELGIVKRIQRSSQSGLITVEAVKTLEECKLGDSIAVNGACLTVTRFDQNTFDADISPETLDKTIVNETRPGDKVNLERALRFSDRLNGHLVSGHIDGAGVITEKKELGAFVVFKIKIPDSLSKYVVEKGSIAIDGISLTINSCSERIVGLSVIPHTAKLTSIGFKGVGARVNIEVDMLVKYVERMLTTSLGGDSDSGPSKRGSGITLEALAKNGFL